MKTKTIKSVKSAYAPMKHQAVSLKHDATSPIIFDTSDPGTGKTAVRIWAFAARRRKGSGCLLVLATRRTMDTVWAADFAKFAPDMKVVIATADNRAKAFAEEADVYVTNHDAVKWVAGQPKAFFEKFSELVIDESTKYKHATAQRSKAAAKISQFFERKACLTGTPNSNGICDVWHQAYLLDGGKRLGKSFFAFRNTVCVPTQVGRSQHAVRWDDKPGAEEAVFGLLQDIVIRHHRDDCVDIPATHTYDLPYTLPPKQLQAYEHLEAAQLLVLFETPQDRVASKLTTGNTQPAKITAINAAAVATKLLQLCSGAVYESKDKYHVLDTGRYEMILDLVEERKHSLVFFYWKHQRDELIKEAQARKIKYCVIDGNTSDADAVNLQRAYQAGLYQVMFAHPESIAHGVTLTKGTATIWPGPTFNLEWWEQGNLRQARIGQTQKTEVIVIVAKDTVEEKVYEMLMKKNERMRNLLDLFATLVPAANDASARTRKRA